MARVKPNIDRKYRVISSKWRYRAPIQNCNRIYRSDKVINFTSRVSIKDAYNNEKKEQQIG